MSPRILKAGLALSAILFALGVYYLLQLRFESGDVYPPYSSLRADPLGTMALYESLESSGAISVRRDFSEAGKLPEGRGTTYLHLGAEPRDWRDLDDDVQRDITRFVVEGGRLVVCLEPQVTRPWRTRELEPDTAKADSKRKRKKLTAPPDKPERWNLPLAFVPMGEPNAKQAITVTNTGIESLPAMLPWHSGMVMTNLDSVWSIIYSRGTNTVVAERKYGAGSVVVATDSYLLSNEALGKEAQPAFLTWLIGDARLAMFDEAHLGVVESVGVATLIRRYNLGGLVAALIALAGLYIWKASASFLPPAPQARAASHVHGRPASDGLVNLLRRNVTPADLPVLGFEQWKTVAQVGTKQEQVSAAERVLADYSQRIRKDPVAVMRDLGEILKHVRIKHENRRS